MKMQDYHPLPDLISDGIIERVKKLSPAQLCDGMKSLGIHRDGCLDAAVMPACWRETTMVGTAYTVDTEEGDNFPIHVALYQDRPGYVLMIAGKGYTERPYLGDLIVGTAEAIGLQGIVVDGYVRDRAGIRNASVPVYSKGFMQRGPGKKGPGKINTPVFCAGVLVNPGDLVVGDTDGVTVVPRERLDEVLAKAEEKDTYETRRRSVIAAYAKARKNGDPLPDLVPDWVAEKLPK